MAEISLSVDVEASAAQTWAAAVDWPTQGEWMFLTRVEATSGDGHAVGDELAAYTGLGPLRFLDTMVITAYDAPRRCVVRHTGRVVRGTAAFEVIDVGAGRSRFVWSEWLELPLGFIGELGFALLRPLVLLPLRSSLAKFAAHAAARPAP